MPQKVPHAKASSYSNNYDKSHYPRAQHLLDASLVINDQASPIYIEDVESIWHYKEAIRKSAIGIMNFLNEL
jgi:hypothetical protein